MSEILRLSAPVLITDRTEADLENETDKAFIDYEDLNRLGNAIEIIKTWLEKSGYSVTLNPKTDWTMFDIRSNAEMVKLRNSINTIVQIYKDAPNPILPSTIEFASITEANNIEKILLNCYTYAKGTYESYSFSGTIFSGEV